MKTSFDPTPDVMVKVWGTLALFCVPHLMSDPFSYPACTPSAGKQILRNIWSKPEFEYVIRRIHVHTPPRYQSQMVQVIKGSGNAGPRSLQTQTMLVRPEYTIEADIVVNRLRTNRPKAAYVDMVRRHMRAGTPTRSLYLGVAECPAEFELVDSASPDPSVDIDVGTMLWDLVPRDLGTGDHRSYPDKFTPVFFRANVAKGTLVVPPALFAKHGETIMRVRDRAHVRRGDETRDMESSCAS